MNHIEYSVTMWIHNILSISTQKWSLDKYLYHPITHLSTPPLPFLSLITIHCIPFSSIHHKPTHTQYVPFRIPSILALSPFAILKILLTLCFPIPRPLYYIHLHVTYRYDDIMRVSSSPPPSLLLLSTHGSLVSSVQQHNTAHYRDWGVLFCKLLGDLLVPHKKHSGHSVQWLALRKASSNRNHTKVDSKAWYSRDGFCWINQTFSWKVDIIWWGVRD